MAIILEEKYLYIINFIVFSAACIIGFQTDILIGFGLVFLIIISVGLLLFIFNKPHLGIILTVCGSMLGPLGNLLSGSEVQDIPLSLFQVSLIFTIYTYVIYRLQRANFKFTFDTPFRLVLLFIGMLIFASLYSYNRSEALIMTITLMVLAIFAYIVSDVFKNKHVFDWLFYAIIILTVYYSIEALYQFIIDPQATYLNAFSAEAHIFERQAGSWRDPNSFGLMLVLPILFIVCELFVKKSSFRNIKIRDIFLLVIFALLFTALMTTYSRSSWLSLMVGVVSLFFLLKKSGDCCY